jgi:hypothetical protein
MQDLTKNTTCSSDRLFGKPARALYLKSHLWLSLIVGLSGCASWSSPPASENAGPKLPAPKLAADTVVVETVLIRFPEDQALALNEIWRVVDESVIDLSVRRELNANGLKCGLLMGEMPQVVRSRLKELNASDPGNSLERLGLAAEVSSETQRLNCHRGRRKELSLRPGLSEDLTIVEMRGGVMRGNRYSQPRLLMDIRATPLGDGRASLKMTPEVEYGDFQDIIVTSPNQVAQRSDVRRPQHRWEHLATEATLKPGQFLLLTLTDPPRGIGQALFSTRTAERTTERVLLVVQLMSSQLDELFAPEEVEAARLAAER